MMENSTQLTRYLSDSIGEITRGLTKNALKNADETVFLLKAKHNLKKAGDKRLESEKNGLHIPAFLISSITHNCNLFCSGCYARANGICHENAVKTVMTADEWKKIFDEAVSLGISFNLLAGGEPLMRKDVILKAAECGKMIFPIFTNGTLIGDEYIRIFEKYRNLIPVVSIEGQKETTDGRRGAGTYEKITGVMELMQNKGMLYGVSVTVSRANYEEVTGAAFNELLMRLGCGLVFYIEYVPVEKGTEKLAFDDGDRAIMEKRLADIKSTYSSAIYISFPGDEKFLGGCLAGGRGFFHINSDGAAEPCPFSPYSDINVRDGGLAAALQSPLFRKLIEQNLTGAVHSGGCSLFEQDDIVKKLSGR